MTSQPSHVNRSYGFCSHTWCRSINISVPVKSSAISCEDTMPSMPLIQFCRSLEKKRYWDWQENLATRYRAVCLWAFPLLKCFQINTFDLAFYASQILGFCFHCMANNSNLLHLKISSHILFSSILVIILYRILRVLLFSFWRWESRLRDNKWFVHVI